MGISEKLESVILYSIAFIHEKNGKDKGTYILQILSSCLIILFTPTSVSLTDGLAATKQYIQSLGRYGSTGFLEGLYGTGSELVQAFCRLE